METKGIRIYDIKDEVLSVKLSDLLKEIENPHEFNWAILFLDGMPIPKKGPFIMPLIKKINESKNGFMIDSEDLFLLSSKFHQIYETVIIGCKDPKFLKNYDSDKEMYKSCEIVLNLIDCAYWEVFSKNPDLIDRLFKKFKDTKFLTLDNFDEI